VGRPPGTAGDERRSGCRVTGVSERGDLLADIPNRRAQARAHTSRCDEQLVVGSLTLASAVLRHASLATSARAVLASSELGSVRVVAPNGAVGAGCYSAGERSAVSKKRSTASGSAKSKIVIAWLAVVSMIANVRWRVQPPERQRCGNSPCPAPTRNMTPTPGPCLGEHRYLAVKSKNHAAGGTTHTNRSPHGLYRLI